MFASVLTAFARSFTRHPLYAGLNLIGLSLGIAVFVAVGLFIRFETSFDSFWPQADKIHIVSTSFTFPGEEGRKRFGTMGGLLEQLQEDYPQTVGTRLWSKEASVQAGDTAYRQEIQAVDPNFLDLFDLKLTSGDRRTALSSPLNAVISQSMATKYFQGKPALGGELRLTDGDEQTTYRVTGIFEDLPLNTDLTLSIVVPISRQQIHNSQSYWRNWGSIQLSTFLKMTPDEARALNADLPAFADRKAPTPPGNPKTSRLMRIAVQPLTSAHLDDPKARSPVYSTGAVGVLAFLIAAINYINLATARAGQRAKEVAVRKSLGATTGALRTQFLLEAVCVCVLAALIGFSLVELSLPTINTIGGLTLKLDYIRDWPAVFGLIGAILLTGLLAGLYPAFVLSAFKPAAVLAASRTPAGGRLAGRIREGLVVLQFTVVVAFFVVVSGFHAQMRHMQTADLGFDRQGLLLIDATRDTSLTPAQRTAFWQGVRALPGVVGVTASDSAPGDEYTTNRSSVAAPGFQGRPATLNWTITGPGYFTVYGARLLAGRLLDQVHGQDQDQVTDEAFSGGLTNVVINATATRALDMASPQNAIGKVLTFGRQRSVRVVGVVDDIRFRDPKEPIAPTLYFFAAEPNASPLTAIRFASSSQASITALVEPLWRQIAPDTPFQAISAVDSLDRYYKPDRDRSRLFSIGAAIAAAIGCIGLYGMAAFNTSRRALEIGLRKVLGASRSQVVRLLVLQFLRPVIMANVLAWPIGGLALSRWLAQFDDAVGMNPIFFGGASLAAIAIALVTVGGLAMASAGEEPGRALRAE